MVVINFPSTLVVPLTVEVHSAVAPRTKPDQTSMGRQVQDHDVPSPITSRVFDTQCKTTPSASRNDGSPSSSDVTGLAQIKGLAVVSKLDINQLTFFYYRIFTLLHSYGIYQHEQHLRHDQL
jgi:hypothetical protein